MAEQDLLNAFNDCIDRMSAGQSIDECLRRYPRFDAALRPMLETGRRVQAVRVSPVEVTQVQERARYRYEEAIRMTASRRRPAPLYRFATLAAAVLLIFLTLSSGAGVLAQSSLPGDPLYGLKLFTEQVRLSFDSSLAAQFDQRRLDETQQLLHMGRAEEVVFQGLLSAIDGTNWTIGGLVVQVSSNTLGASSAHLGDIVEVRAATSSDGQIIAQTITILITAEAPTATPPPTQVPTAFPATARPTITKTALPTLTPPPTPTSSSTPLPSTTQPPVPTSAPNNTVSPAPVPTECEVKPPSGWVSYSIRLGDTLSHLANNRGITLEQLMAVNCLTDPGFIVVGEELYLPPAPQFISTLPPTNGGDNTNLNDNSNSGSDGSSGSNSGSGSSGSNSNDNGDDHGGSSGGGSDDSGG